MPNERQGQIAMKREKNADGLTYKDSDKVVEPSKNIIDPFTEKQANIINGGEQTSESQLLLRLLHSNGIYRREDFDDFNTFYIFPRNDPYRMMGTTREYVFITKPDLHIFGTRQNPNDPVINSNMNELNPELQSIVFFRDLVERNYGDTVLSSLQHGVGQNGTKYISPFVNLLSNYKTSNLDLSNISVGDEESATNIYNTRMFYRKPSDSADEDNEFNIEFKDNRFLDCYLWFKAYDLYEQMKYHGQVTPTNVDYTWYKVLSDQMTVFKFIVGEDGESIVYWAQLWGCYPKSVPRSSFSDMPTDGQMKFTVDWKATFQQDMDPVSITHFNYIVDASMLPGKQYAEIPLFDYMNGRVTGESALFPRIIKTTGTTMTHTPYLLKWFGDPQDIIEYHDTSKPNLEVEPDRRIGI